MNSKKSTMRSGKNSNGKGTRSAMTIESTGPSRMRLKSSSMRPATKRCSRERGSALSLRESEEKKLTERLSEGKKRLEEIENEISGLSGIEALAREIKEKMSAAEERVSALKKQKDGLVMDISRGISALERIETARGQKKRDKY